VLEIRRERAAWATSTISGYGSSHGRNTATDRVAAARSQYPSGGGPSHGGPRIGSFRPVRIHVRRTELPVQANKTWGLQTGLRPQLIQMTNLHEQCAGGVGIMHFQGCVSVSPGPILHRLGVAEDPSGAEPSLSSRPRIGSDPPPAPEPGSRQSPLSRNPSLRFFARAAPEMFAGRVFGAASASPVRALVINLLSVTSPTVPVSPRHGLAA